MAHRRSLGIYITTIAVSSFLLFAVQPIIARFLLPWFGGAPAVWTVCMLFFQVLLLAGYAYAHGIVRHLRMREQAWTHTSLLVVSLLFLPIGASHSWKPQGVDYPQLHLLLLLLVMVGLPYFALSATAPLVQSWFSRRNPEVSPYPLYALSNVAALGALLSYPFAIEPQLSLQQQSFWWSLGYTVFVVLCVLCVHSTKGSLAVEPDLDRQSTAAQPRVAWDVYLLWFLLPCCASVLFLAATNQLCDDVATVPFLWVLPLGLYLLSFILCFDGTGWYLRRYYFPVCAACVYVLCTEPGFLKPGRLEVQLPLWAATIFVFCMTCHGELERLKPAPNYLTKFYLLVACGGAAGGVLVGLIAPQFFDSFLELPGALSAALLVTGVAWYRSMALRFSFRGGLLLRLVLGAACMLAVVYCGWYLFGVFGRKDYVLAQGRNFYGVLSVQESNRGQPLHIRRLMHGRVLHGSQMMHKDRRGLHLSYYGSKSGVFLAAFKYHRTGGRRIGAIGLGTGTIAAYTRPGDVLRFYEINPLVVEYARRYFTFLADARGTVEVVPGDARMSMENEARQNYDLFVIDAFTGDAPPVHLLTEEAFALYLDHLVAGGVIAVHISNLYFDLAPVLMAMADHYELEQVLITAMQDSDYGIYSSSWMLLSRDKEFLQQPFFQSRAARLIENQPTYLWSDDYSSLYPLLRRGHLEEPGFAGLLGLGEVFSRVNE